MTNNYNEYNLKLGYKKVYDKTFVPLCQGVISNLTDNDDFPEVGPLLTELTTLVDDYIASIPSKAERSPVLEAIKNSKRTLVKFQMRKMGFYVLMMADNNLTKLKGTGFEVAKISGTNTPIEFPMPMIKSLHTNGTPRQLIVKVQAIKGAPLYDVRVSTDKENWTIFTNTASKVLANEMPTEVTLYVQARYRKGSHETPWSSIMETRIFDSVVALAIAN